MASNSYGYGGYQDNSVNKSQGYGYGGYDEKVSVKPTKAEKPVKEPPKPKQPKEAPRPPPGKKRQSHSRHMPIFIVLIVLTLGMVFIGLVMTIVAHWPGYSAIGGNPLEVAGPVLLSVGSAGFIICMLIVCTQKKAEKKTYQKRFTKLATSARMATMQQNVSMMQNSYMIQHQNRMPSMGSIAMHESQAPQTPSVYTDDQHSYSQNMDGFYDGSVDPNTPGVVPTPVRPSSRKTKKQEALGDDVDVEYGTEEQQPKKKHRHRQEQDGEPKKKSKKTPATDGQLRIDIKAQPGTSVHIAPGANYSPPPGTVSSETEI